jgi:hypothetical protein
MKVGENMVIFGQILKIDDDSIITDGKIDATKLNPPIRIPKAIFLN